MERLAGLGEMGYQERVRLGCGAVEGGKESGKMPYYTIAPARLGIEPDISDNVTWVTDQDLPECTLAAT